MWYVIQTVTGKEQELVQTIEHVLEESKRKNVYNRCFVLYRECIWRLGGQFRFHTEPLFPSYVFVETEQPEAFYLALKQVPKLAKLLGADGSFWSIGTEEERFLASMLETAEEEDASPENREQQGRQENPAAYLIRCSLVHVDEERQIISAEGALKNYLDRIVKQRLRKRSVIIEVPFLGEIRRIQLGIRLEEDG